MHTDHCYHCGDPCREKIVVDQQPFCCTGCSQVYLLLNENDLCNYYDLNNKPGIKATGKFTGTKFAYLDDASVLAQLADFIGTNQVNLTLSLPQIHCASCIFLLENLHRIEAGVISCRVYFESKEMQISFDPGKTSLRKIAEVMAFIGYEPAFSLQDTEAAPKRRLDRTRIVQLGVAGFCFSNIMMLSFPEYFSGGHIEVQQLGKTFTGIIFLLSLPVILYSAAPIMISAWKSLRQGVINIDAPIAFASIITFTRSYVEIISGSGVGYLDSGTGIIFFMLIGRWFQSKTYDALAFDRQYKSYFPLGITVLRAHKEENIPVTKLKLGDIIIVRNEEMIPADAVLIEGKASIDYSFVSGENEPVLKQAGDHIYAGGKQTAAAIKLRVMKEPSQSYITQLWNNDIFSRTGKQEPSFIHPWSRYFTAVLFSIALLTGLYWWMNDPTKLWPAVTAVLIVACPCSLLLSATFTFGNMQRVLGRNNFFLKNAAVIESLAAVQHIVFDKTGTLTGGGASTVKFYGQALSLQDEGLVKLAASQSSHPLSRALAHQLPPSSVEGSLTHFSEMAGSGIWATFQERKLQMGSATFTGGINSASREHTNVHVKINESYKGYYEIRNPYRAGIQQMAEGLRRKGYQLHILSGDHPTEKNNLQLLFGENTPMHFNASPQQKLDYIHQLRSGGKKVLMAGDGLNDAGALMEADCGIAISDDAARFSPACDAIIEGQQMARLPDFLSFAKWNRRIVTAGFVLSICYNIAGLSFAVQAKLSPLTAAILMPASSISIILLSWLLTTAVARRHSLDPKHDETHFLV
ncbi:MAG: HAD family hydrolase [Chitinophagaceae bacterium]|nr:MAG: HAD family hydrolase [Chitinophagaceae bacterium]